MMRSLLILSSLTAALVLAGCASQPAAPASPAAAAAAAADDATIASKLKGNWTGDWSTSGAGGKFDLVVTEVVGTDVKGSATWFGTAVGDYKAPISKGTVKNGVLSVEQAGGWTFEVKLKDDKTLAGTWSVAGYSGMLNLKKQ